jgi:hypothetical protein
MNHTWLADQPPWKMKTPCAAPSKNRRLPRRFQNNVNERRSFHYEVRTLILGGVGHTEAVWSVCDSWFAVGGGLKQLSEAKFLKASSTRRVPILGFLVADKSIPVMKAGDDSDIRFYSPWATDVERRRIVRLAELKGAHVTSVARRGKAQADEVASGWSGHTRPAHTRLSMARNSWMCGCSDFSRSATGPK